MIGIVYLILKPALTESSCTCVPDKVHVADMSASPLFYSRKVPGQLGGACLGNRPQLFLQGQLHPYGQVTLFWRGLQAHAKLGNSNRGRLFLPGVESLLRSPLG